jgi:hypothetical protein
MAGWSGHRAGCVELGYEVGGLVEPAVSSAAVRYSSCESIAKESLQSYLCIHG